MSDPTLTRSDLESVIDRDDPRLLYFLRLVLGFERRKCDALTKPELEALWEAAERSRLIAIKANQVDDASRNADNYGVGLSVVYYIRLGSRIKIGTSTCVRKRIKTFNPESILGLEPGGISEERARHRQFAHLRTRGEWFRAEPELVEFAASLPSRWRQYL